MERILGRHDVEALRRTIQGLLDDPELALTRSARLRYEGALTALEVVLGESPSLHIDD